MRRRFLVVNALVIAVVLFIFLQPVSGPEDGVPPTVTAVLPTLAACSESPAARLTSGDTASVILPGQGRARRNLVVRDEPGGEQVGLLEPGTRFRITGDSLCAADGLRWWPVQAGDLAGWSVEGFAPEDYLMVPER